MQVGVAAGPTYQSAKVTLSFATSSTLMSQLFHLAFVELHYYIKM